ncbi:MAG: DUF4339 domain-containing protein [Terricaulis sp.]
MQDAAVTADTATPATWWVQVRGQAYGPYTLDQLARFVEEGRVRPATRISDSPSTGWIEARRVDALMAPLRAAAPNEQPANEGQAAEAANVFVHAEILSGAWGAFMAALESMGVIADLAPGLWLIRTRFGAGVIRNTLSQTLERGDRFVVIDATRDRLAWFNLGPENDVHIREVWNGPLRAEKK